MIVSVSPSEEDYRIAEIAVQSKRETIEEKVTEARSLIAEAKRQREGLQPPANEPGFLETVEQAFQEHALDGGIFVFDPEDLFGDRFLEIATVLERLSPELSLLKGKTAKVKERLEAFIKEEIADDPGVRRVPFGGYWFKAKELPYLALFLRSYQRAKGLPKGLDTYRSLKEKDVWEALGKNSGTQEAATKEELYALREDLERPYWVPPEVFKEYTQIFS